MTNKPMSLEELHLNFNPEIPNNIRPLLISQNNKITSLETQLTEAKSLLREMIATIERRLNGDEACGHPFDEDLGDALEKARKIVGPE